MSDKDPLQTTFEDGRIERQTSLAEQGGADDGV